MCDNTFDILDQGLIQIALTTMALTLTFTCDLVIKKKQKKTYGPMTKVYEIY